MIVLGVIMSKPRNYEFLEHTADAYIAAYGKSLEEAFENSALAMFEVMTDTQTISPIEKDFVEVEAEDKYALLYSWLEALLVKSEVKQMLFSKFKILELQETPSGFKIKATIWGEPFNPKKHIQKVGVKAVTYHRMVILQETNKVTLEFILDI